MGGMPYTAKNVTKIEEPMTVHRRALDGLSMKKGPGVRMLKMSISADKNICRNRAAWRPSSHVVHWGGVWYTCLVLHVAVATSLGMPWLKVRYVFFSILSVYRSKKV